MGASSRKCSGCIGSNDPSGPNVKKITPVESQSSGCCQADVDTDREGKQSDSMKEPEPEQIPDKVPPKSGQDSALKASADGKEEKATVVYADGSTYTGQLKGGLRSGNGVWLTPIVQFQGQWNNDLQEGRGKLTWSDGREYAGEFHLGKFHGHGRMVWRTENLKGVVIYEGQYVDDAKHGSGRFEWPDGGVYEGGWAKGKKSGQGCYTNPRGESRRGEWVEDRVERWLDSPPQN
mmetsp:Transcript_112025/g.215710  ORF Transcript_112025/g.215710 Transcript_112025/m.215710 type:complete len:234 (+) Transcript_112025:77-778(+)